MLYPGDRFRMADEMLETYIRQLLESHRTPEVTIAWQGGEPTMMGLDFFRRSMELVEQYRRPEPADQSTRSRPMVSSSMIDWAAFFKEHGFLVGLSIDGPEELHDAYRVDKRGEGSFDRVMAGLEALQAREVDVNVLCTVHAANLHDLRSRCTGSSATTSGVRFMQFIPMVERIDRDTADDRQCWVG